MRDVFLTSTLATFLIVLGSLLVGYIGFQKIKSQRVSKLVTVTISIVAFLGVGVFSRMTGKDLASEVYKFIVDPVVIGLGWEVVEDEPRFSGELSPESSSGVRELSLETSEELVWRSNASNADIHQLVQAYGLLISKRECQPKSTNLPFEYVWTNLEQGSDKQFLLMHLNNSNACPNLGSSYTCGSAGCSQAIFEFVSGRPAVILYLGARSQIRLEPTFTHGMRDLDVTGNLWIWSKQEAKYVRAGS
ncbi:MAG: hypothetical protein ABJM82_06080 [Shimia thalassica]|uniref:hypothetical protein n=1 Tax=Rhodobacterales TaxID=204455 RepID=UPI00329873B3